MFVGRLEGGVCRERWGRIGGGRGREIRGGMGRGVRAGLGCGGDGGDEGGNGGMKGGVCGLDLIFDSNPKSNFLNNLLTLYIDSTLQSVSMMAAQLKFFIIAQSPLRSIQFGERTCWSMYSYTSL